MNLKIDKQFSKDVKRLKNPDLHKRLAQLLRSIQTATSIEELKGVKKLTGHTAFYRIRLGAYRIGAEIQGNTITLIRFLHRKEIYTYFP